MPRRPPPVAIFVLLVLARAAFADGPAAIAPDGPDRRARESFERFVSAWMSELRERASQRRERPSVRHGPWAPLVTYRAYGDDVRIEIRPTGRASASHSGILHFTEHVYSCSDLRAQRCRIASSTPVTEIFHFRDGRWGY